MLHKEYFVDLGAFAAGLATIIVMASIAITQGVAPNIFDFIFPTIFVAVLYFIITYSLTDFKIIKITKIKNRTRLAYLMILMGFVSLELYNAFVSFTQGYSYFPDPAFYWNFLVNKFFNLVAVVVSFGCLFWLHPPPKPRK